LIYASRWEFLEPRIRDRSVLDVGPAELVGTVNREKMDHWLHGRMSQAARRLVGLEANGEQIAPLRALGFDLRLGDAETFALGDRFDVVVAGELIEHLSNPGLFLDRVREHLAPAGRLLLTTPNRFSILANYRLLRTGRVPRYEKDLAKHVAYFDSDALSSLLERHGFRVEEIAYCQWVGKPSAGRLARGLVRWASRFRPATLPTLMMAASVDDAPQSPEARELSAAP
jgi:SAM-dependent methyltransferase